MNREGVIELIRVCVNKSRESESDEAEGIYELLSKYGLLANIRVHKHYHREKIRNAIWEVFRVDVKVKSRKSEFVTARKIATWFYDTHTSMNLLQIAEEFGIMTKKGTPDHSAAIHYRNSVRENREKLQHLINEVYEVLDK